MNATRSLAVAAGLALALAAPALAAANPCAPEGMANPCNPCAPRMSNPCNPCAPKGMANPCNPCAPKARPAARRAKVDARKVDPAAVTYTQLRGLSASEFGTVVGRGAKVGQALMGGVPVAGREAALEGEVVDLVCYTGAGLTSGKHALCARVCALKGGAVGLLTADGTVYQILPEKAGEPVSDAVLDAIATRVRVTGNVNERGGLHTIAIKRIERR